jgi:hypothetical protein
MRVPTCVECDQPVLELLGQFEKLDSYYLDEDGPPRETAGYWHTLCLTQSPHGPAWCAARLRNHVEVRRHEVVAEVGSWTIVRDRRTREPLAFSRSGEFLHLEGSRGKARKVDGGSVHPIVTEYNLELDDRDLISTVHDELNTIGSYSILKIMNGMGIADRVNHPIALERAVFRSGRPVPPEWQSRCVSAQAEYGRFVPSELMDFFRRGAT